MKMNKWVLCTLALTPAASFAQFDFGGGSSAPAGSAWSTFKLPKTKIKLDFRNASIDSILAFFSKSSGIAIVKDPALTGNLSLTSPTSVSIDDAFELLSVTLDLKNFELKKQGKALVVRAKQAGRGGGGSFGASGMTAEQIASMSQAFSGSNTDLKVYPLKNANAAQVARVINEVFASSQSPLDQFIQQMAGGGATGGFGGNTGGGGRTGGGNNPFSFGGRQGGGGRTGGGGFGGRGGGTSQQSIKASSDDYSNSVIVNAPKSDQNKVEDLIKQLDKETEQPLRPLVYKLEYASANDLAVAVQNVLTTNAPRGRGGQGQQGQNIGQQFQQAFRLGSAQAAFGTVVADVRTNSLIVTATEENHVLVKAVLKELDSPIELQSSTFVVQLANARADQVATLLNQTFGGRTTNTGAANGVGRGANATGRTNNQNNAGGGGGGGQNAGGGRSVPTQQELEEGAMNLDNIDPDTGEFYPLVAVQQGGGFGQLFGQGGGQRQGGGFGGGQNRNQTTQQATGRDANGKLVNLRDLSGQVTVIPDQNTNSLIIVTSPDNVQLIQNILNQLDRIPEQVMIETIIVEATLDASDKFGVEWKLIQNNIFGTQGKTGTGESTFGNANANPALQGFKYTIAGGNLTGFLNAMATDKKFQVLSTPRIFTSNNSQAQINISQRVPYVLSSRTDANGNLTYTYGFEDVGIVLTVTPRITSNGYVTMEVNQTANDLQGFTDFNAPIINQREADTTVSVLDGETVILGGIIRSSVTSTVKKIPLLGDIPILGNLFKSSEKSKSKTELLVFLSPRIVKNSDEAQKLKDEEQKKLSPQTKKSVEGLTVPKPRSAETKPPEMKKKEDSKKPK